MASVTVIGPEYEMRASDNLGCEALLRKSHIKAEAWIVCALYADINKKDWQNTRWVSLRL